MDSDCVVYDLLHSPNYKNIEDKNDRRVEFFIAFYFFYRKHYCVVVCGAHRPSSTSGEVCTCDCLACAVFGFISKNFSSKNKRVILKHDL